MTGFLVVVTLFKCPFWLPSGLPPEVKARVCQVRHPAVLVRAIEDARAVIEMAGPEADPKLYSVNGEKYKEIPVRFKPVLEIMEVK